MVASTSSAGRRIWIGDGEVDVAKSLEVGSLSQGDTIEDALANLHEATELSLEACPEPNGLHLGALVFVRGDS